MAKLMQIQEAQEKARLQASMPLNLQPMSIATPTVPAASTSIFGSSIVTPTMPAANISIFGSAVPGASTLPRSPNLSPLGASPFGASPFGAMPSTQQTGVPLQLNMMPFTQPFVGGNAIVPGMVTGISPNQVPQQPIPGLSIFTQAGAVGVLPGAIQVSPFGQPVASPMKDSPASAVPISPLYGGKERTIAELRMAAGLGGLASMQSTRPPVDRRSDGAQGAPESPEDLRIKSRELMGKFNNVAEGSATLPTGLAFGSTVGALPEPTPNLGTAAVPNTNTPVRLPYDLPEISTFPVRMRCGPSCED